MRRLPIKALHFYAGQRDGLIHICFQPLPS